MRRIRSSTKRAHLAQVSKQIVEGSYDLAEGWIVNNDCRVVAEETYRRISAEQAQKVVRASQMMRVNKLYAIVNDDEIVRPSELVFEVRPTLRDLALADAEFFGLNLLLFNDDKRIALLSTYDEYSVLAAPHEFVRAYEPDLERAIQDFCDFIPTQPPGLQPAPARALRLMETYGRRAV